MLLSVCYLKIRYLRLLIGTYLRGPAPVYSCLGRPIRKEDSSIISFHWEIQPTVLDTANSTVNIEVGKPIALKMMPE